MHELPEVRRYNLGRAPRIRYTRKSTEGDDRQIASHAQQGEALDRKFGPLPEPLIWFWDSHTGTTFDRPGFAALVEFCRRNPQPEECLGVIEVYDMSRFGRILGSNGFEDIYAVAYQMAELRRLGWDIAYATMDKAADPFVDYMQTGIHAYSAANFARKLSRDVARGQRNWKSKGRWVSGVPPFGTRRADPTTGEVLSEGIRAKPGGTVLVGDEEELAAWRMGAEMLLAGEPYSAIAAAFADAGVKSTYGAPWDHGNVKIVLTNYALIGEIHYTPVNKAGEGQPEIFKAAWEPLVDPTIFAAVIKEVARRNGGKKYSARRTRALIPMTCTQCEAPFYAHGGYTDKRAVPRRRSENPSYYHPAPGQRLPYEWRQRIKRAGCRHWRIDAEAVHSYVGGLLSAERGTPNFVRRLKETLQSEFDLIEAHSARVNELERKAHNIRERQDRLVAMAEQAAARRVGEAAFFTRMERLEAELLTTEDQLLDARDQLTKLSDLDRILNEITKDCLELQKRWATAKFAERKLILDRWIKSIVVEVHQKKGQYHSSGKTLHVELRVIPKDLLRNGEGPIDVFQHGIGQ